METSLDRSRVEKNIFSRHELNGMVRDVFVRANFRRYLLLLIDLLPVPMLVTTWVGNLNSNQYWLLFGLLVTNLIGATKYLHVPF